MVNERVEQMKRQQFISLDSQFIYLRLLNDYLIIVDEYTIVLWQYIQSKDKAANVSEQNEYEDE